MHYVRKKPKGFGVNAHIEGNNIREKGYLIEDLTTDGGSKIKFCDSIRKAGAKVEFEPIVMEHGYNMNDEHPYFVAKNWEDIYFKVVKG